MTELVRELALTMAADGPAQADERSVEAGILGRAKAGDAAAFEQILLLHERSVYRTAVRLLDNVEDAKDAAQEVFLRLYRHLRRFDETRELSPWLYRVTVNVCRDVARRRHKQAHALLGDTPAASEDMLSRGESRQLIAEALKSLPEKERAAIVLRDIEGLSTAEVARILGSRETTVRSQISSARVKIRRFVVRIRGRGR